MRRNSEFVKLAVTLVISSLLTSGLQETNSQYLSTEFGFKYQDFAILFMAFGAGGCIVQVCFVQVCSTPVTQ